MKTVNPYLYDKVLDDSLNPEKRRVERK